MRTLTLSDLKLGIGDLLSRRVETVRATRCGAIYEPLLRASLDAIHALPAVTFGSRPLSDQLSETDVVHDGFGNAVWYLTEAYLRLPTATKKQRAAAQRIRDVFVPSLASLQASYADEAQAALDHRPKLDELRADLELFPVAGATLAAWVDGQLKAGVKLDELLRARADAAPGSRKEAATLRSKAIGQLQRFRDALADERDVNRKLDADLEARLFGYIDQLAAMRDRGGSPGEEDAPVDPPNPPTG